MHVELHAQALNRCIRLLRRPGCCVHLGQLQAQGSFFVVPGGLLTGCELITGAGVAVLDGVTLQRQLLLTVEHLVFAVELLLRGPVVGAHVEIRHERIAHELVVVPCERVAGVGVELARSCVGAGVLGGNRHGRVIHRGVSRRHGHAAIEQAPAVGRLQCPGAGLLHQWAVIGNDLLQLAAHGFIGLHVPAGGALKL